LVKICLWYVLSTNRIRADGVKNPAGRDLSAMLYTNKTGTYVSSSRSETLIWLASCGRIIGRGQCSRLSSLSRPSMCTKFSRRLDTTTIESTRFARFVGENARSNAGLLTATQNLTFLSDARKV
jgi:hypothetical protein